MYALCLWRNEMDLLKGNLKKIYLKFLIPSLGSAMVMSIYTLTDAIVIGKGNQLFNIILSSVGSQCKEIIVYLAA